MDSDDMLNSHFASAFYEMSEIVVDLDAQNVKVVSVTKDEKGCDEGYPCFSHSVGLLCINDNIQYNVKPVTAGYVQYFYFPKKETHFTPFCTKYARKHVDDFRRCMMKK